MHRPLRLHSGADCNSRLQARGSTSFRLGVIVLPDTLPGVTRLDIDDPGIA
jgi:hypothetical protein